MNPSRFGSAEAARHQGDAMKPRVLALIAAVAVLTLSIAPHGATAQAKKRIGVAFYSQTIPLYVEMRTGMEAEAAKRGVDLEFQYSGPDAQQQSNQIANFVTKKVDLILCSPFDKNALLNAYKAARAAGVPVISVANSIASTADEDAYVGSDWAKFGVLEMTAAVKAIGGKGTVGIIEGPPPISFVFGWDQGVQSVLAKNPGVIPVKLNGGLTIEAGLTEASNILTAHPDVKAIVSVSDELAEGTAQALKERGIAPGKVWVGGWDGYPQVVDMIKNNAGIDYTISNRGYTWGVLAVDTAADFLAGKKPKTHEVENPTVEITHANVNKLTYGSIH
jgi:ribose transport system substrate-binding protein